MRCAMRGSAGVLLGAPEPGADPGVEPAPGTLLLLDPRGPLPLLLGTNDLPPGPVPCLISPEHPPSTLPVDAHSTSARNCPRVRTTRRPAKLPDARTGVTHG